MTGICQAIEEGLWTNNTLRLGKQDDGALLRPGRVQSAPRTKLDGLVKNEIEFLERLAFAGLYNEVVEFGTYYFEVAFGDLSLLFDKTIPNLSFLRSSDSLSGGMQRSYHFIHLAYQEYFAARYFVRQRKANKPLQYGKRTPTQLSLPHSSISIIYTARYDILWRFVAGLQYFFSSVEVYRS